jgi:hypothetical protein
MQDAADERLKILYQQVEFEQDTEKFIALLKEINNLLEAKRLDAPKKEID